MNKVIFIIIMTITSAYCADWAECDDQLAGILKTRDQTLKFQLSNLLESITIKSNRQEKLPLLVGFISKLSGYHPPIHKIATLNYPMINTPSYKSSFIKILLPFISDDFSPELYPTIKDALSPEEERENGSELANLLRIACESHKYLLQEEKYQLQFDPHEETAAIGVLINIFFEAAEQKLTLEKSSLYSL